MPENAQEGQPQGSWLRSPPASHEQARQVCRCPGCPAIPAGSFAPPADTAPLSEAQLCLKNSTGTLLGRAIRRHIPMLNLPLTEQPVHALLIPSISFFAAMQACIQLCWSCSWCSPQCNLTCHMLLQCMSRCCPLPVSAHPSPLPWGGCRALLRFDLISWPYSSWARKLLQQGVAREWIIQSGACG